MNGGRGDDEVAGAGQDPMPSVAQVTVSRLLARGVLTGVRTAETGPWIIYAASVREHRDQRGAWISTSQAVGMIGCTLQELRHAVAAGLVLARTADQRPRRRSILRRVMPLCSLGSNEY